MRSQLSSDPFNLIITGIGGQGNVLASRLVGNMLSQQGVSVTIGETFGASQRGGPVMSHMRLSSGASLSPQIPKGNAHMVVSLEPVETLRVLKDYGNSNVKVLCNTRPIHPLGVICGEQVYPSPEDIRQWIEALSEIAWFIDPTEEALKLGHSILSNVIMVGAMAATGVLPLTRELLEAVLGVMMSEDKVALNLKAFDKGMQMIH